MFSPAISSLQTGDILSRREYLWFHLQLFSEYPQAKDGLWVHIKEKSISEKPILFVLGITLDNKKELLAFKLAKSESELEVNRNTSI